jgi:hypothetical protein
MRKIFVIALLFLSAAFASSCSNPSSAYTGQDFRNAVWKPDGSGIVSLFERYDASSTTAPGVYTFGLFNPDGSIASTVSTSDSWANPVFPAYFYVSQDGRTAIVQLGVANPNANLVAVDLTSGNQRLIASKVNLLGCSPDLKYAIVSPSPLGTQPIIKISVLNISGSQAYEVKNFDLANVFTNAGALWLTNGEFAITVTGSPWQIDIFDTTGKIVDSIPNGELLFRQGNFIAQTNDFYYINPNAGGTNVGGIDRYNIVSKQPPTHIYANSDGVTDFDVSSDGTLIAMVTSTPTSSSSNSLWALNTATGHRNLITGDLVWGAFLSPNAQKVAYVHQQSGNTNFDEILVSPIAKP